MMQQNQIPFDLSLEPSFAREDFIVSVSNQAALSLLDSWQSWSGHVAAIIGPSASGKSHLAHTWAYQASAINYTNAGDIADLKTGQAILFEDADAAFKDGTIDEDQFFHLFNWVKEKGGRLLVTAKKHPTKWPVSLPDLKSRLATIQVGEIKEPDDTLLVLLLGKLFSDRQLTMNGDVLIYITERIDRSFSTAFELVDMLDRAALSGKRKITKPLVKSCLDVLTNG